MILVDFSEAFNTVDQQTLWKVLQLLNSPERVVQIIKFFHEGMTGAVRITGDTGEAFTFISEAIKNID